jgi:exoribonuclease II
MVITPYMMQIWCNIAQQITKNINAFEMHQHWRVHFNVLFEDEKSYLAKWSEKGDSVLELLLLRICDK